MWLAAGLALGLCGCAGYRLGPTSAAIPRGRSIEVNFFQNDTLEPPRLAEEVNRVLRETLQRDGTYQLNTRGDGDVTVNGVLRNYERNGVTFLARDTLTTADYQLVLVAHVTATERATGKVLLDKEVRGKVTIYSTRDLTSAERQALPLLAADLAQNTTTLLTEGTW
ncbi:MAG TPA: LPS assembly lipoprotein LptE [Candidatus Nitrosotalea sp.]|nr:LPS assembly lipoprotein LptE [Candidatus Nitrosotalea sp.]